MLTIHFVRIDGDTVDGVLDPYLDPACDCEAFTKFTGRLFENRSALPRFYPVRNVILEFKGNDFVRRLSEQRDFSHTAVVKTLPVTSDVMRTDLLAPRPLGSPEATVTILPSTPTDFRLRIHAPRHGLIVSSQPWWPGWRVTINGQRREPQPVNGAFLGFTVPPGDWDVRVDYFPLTFYLGLATSLLTVAALVVLALRSRHRPAPAAASAG